MPSGPVTAFRGQAQTSDGGGGPAFGRDTLLLGNLSELVRPCRLHHHYQWAPSLRSNRQDVPLGRVARCLLWYVGSNPLTLWLVLSMP